MYAPVTSRRPLQDVVAGWRPTTHAHLKYCPGTNRDIQVEPEIDRSTNSAPVLTTIQRIDRFIKGFPPGNIYLLASQHEFMFNLIARMIVNTVKASDRDVIYVDGGNSLDPYLLTNACRLFRIDADSLLRRVQVARAFTVFQLDTLITQKLEHILARHKPRLVLISCISELFLDRDVNWHEAKTLFETDFHKLETLTKRYNVTTLLTNFGHDKSVHRFELDRQLRNSIKPEHRLSIRMPSRRKLRFIKGNGEFLDYLPLPPYQWSLDDFCSGGDLCG
jgi:hypothetical protein